MAFIAGKKAARLAEEEGQRGLFESSRKHFEFSRRLFRALLACTPADTEFLGELSVVLDNLGEMQLTLGAVDSAVATFQEAVELDRRRIEIAPGSLEARRFLSYSQSSLAYALEKVGRFESALISAKEAADLARDLLEVEPERFQTNELLLAALERQGDIQTRLSEYGEALCCRRAALDAARSYHSTRHGDDLAEELVAVCRYRLASALYGVGRNEAAIAEVGISLQSLRRLSKKCPEYHQLYACLSSASARAASVYESEERWGEAITHRRAAAEYARHGLNRSPEDPSKAWNLSRSLSDLACTLIKCSHKLEATTTYREAIGLLEEFAATYPGRSDFAREASRIRAALRDLKA